MRLHPGSKSVEKLGALYWRKMKAAQSGGDNFTVAREVLLECMQQFDERVLEGGTLGADLLRRYAAERGIHPSRLFRELLNISYGSHTAKNYLQRGKTPGLLTASTIELGTEGWVPMETWLIGGGSVQGETIKAARAEQSRRLHRAQKSAYSYLAVRSSILHLLHRWVKARLPPSLRDNYKRPEYKALKDYAKAKGFLDAKERFYERIAPSAAVAEDWRVLCDEEGKPVYPGDYDAVLESYSYAAAERRRAVAEERSAAVRRRLGGAGGRPREDGEAAGGAGPAGS